MRAVYKPYLISTVVDRIIRYLGVVVYKPYLISTVVDPTDYIKDEMFINLI